MSIRAARERSDVQTCMFARLFELGSRSLEMGWILAAPENSLFRVLSEEN